MAAAIPLVIAVTLPWADHQLGPMSGFTAAWLALIFAFDLVTGILLLAQYRMGAGPRLLLLSCGFLWSASMAALIACTAPGVLAAEPLFGGDPNSIWWLWLLRHVGPPVFIALALAPWPTGVEGWASEHRKHRRHGRHAPAVMVAAVGLVVLLVVEAPDVLPVIFDETIRRLTPGATTFVLLVNLAAVIVGIVGVVRRGSHRGLESWAIVAAVAFLGDVFYTSLGEPRFTVAEYGARALGLAGAVTVLLFMLRDISLLHQRVSRDARRLEEQNAELREANALREHMTAVVSHDMRTPLAGVQGYLEMLQDDQLDPAFAKRMIDRSWLLTRRVTLLAEDLLAVATQAHADLFVIREQLDMELQLAECAACFPDLDLQVECEPGLTVYADSLRLQQILANLVRNAQKHGAEPVLIRASADEAGVTILVSDAGADIPEDFVPHLFDRYTQGGPAKGGSGLGLSVVKDLVAAHDGDVRYDAATNAFVVRLPQASADMGRPMRPLNRAPGEFDESVRV